MALPVFIIAIEFIVSLSLLCFLTCIVMKRAKRLALLAPKIQEKFNRQPINTETNYTLQGFRVIDLSTVVAGPTTSRMLRELGAEVVKVEDRRGDYWRRFFLEYQQPRKWSVGFDVANMGKASIILDLKSLDGIREFKKLLRDADILVTNIRKKALEKLGLDYPNLAKEFPQLVYAHISAWGQVGPECSLPGYDIGAFHAMSGLAKLVGKTEGTQAMYSNYPIAQGDCSTGIALASGCLTALTSRLITGKGQYVHSSLLATGVYSLSAVFSQMANREYDPKNAHPTHLPYICKDNKSIQLLGLGFENEQTVELQRLFGISFKLDTASLKTILTKKFASMTRNEAVSCLSRSKVLFTVPRRWKELMQNPTRYEAQQVLRKSGADVGMDDVDSVIRIPFEMSSGIEGATFAGPAHGAHTDDFLTNGWTSKKSKTFKANFTASRIKCHKQPLKAQRLHIIELSYVGSSVASSSRWFAELGATVTKILPEKRFDEISRGSGWRDFWANRYPSFGYHLDYGKTKITMNLNNPKLKEMIGDAGLFMTNYPRSLLMQHGLNWEALRKQYPNLIYALVTPKGLQFAETPVHDVGPFYCDCSVWETYSSGMPLTIHPPLQLGELLTSIPLTFAINAAILHREIHLEGNFVHVSLLSASAFFMYMGWALAVKTPAFLELNNFPDINSAYETFPAPLTNCFRTKDGVWLMFLGVELFKHLGNFVKALEMWIIYPKILKHFVFDIALGSKKEPKFIKAMPMFKTMNTLIAQRVANLTHAELKKRLDKFGCWYCYVRDPIDTRRSEQAAANKFFRDCKFYSGTVTLVKMPLEFGFLCD